MEFNAILVSTVSISVFHTIAGPDHYVPFAAIGKAKNWTLYKLIFWTLLCGIAHVLASVVLASIGIGLGFGISKIEWFDDIRGNLAGWVLFLFGILYMIYGFIMILRKPNHKHFDIYEDGTAYVYSHNHKESHYDPEKRKKVTPWVIFIIFLFGPCEALIPLMTYPAVSRSTFNTLVLVATFLTGTLLTMVTMVLFLYWGYNLVKLQTLEKYTNVIAGIAIALCGIWVLFLE